jgi:hypothetical protein
MMTTEAITEAPVEPTAAPIPATEPSNEPSTVPTEEPTATPVESGPTTIQCKWRSSFETLIITEMCDGNVKFPVPYACDGDNGYKVCCSVSSISDPFDSGKYGNCYKA